MTQEHFETVVKKVTKQYGKWVGENKSANWEKQKEFLQTLLIRNKLLKTDQAAEFWLSVGTTCDFVDMPNRKSRDKDWKWEVDVCFCVLYIEHVMKKWSNRKPKVNEYV